MFSLFKFSLNHLYVFSIPSGRLVRDVHPKLFNFDTSSNFLGVPSGLDLSHKISPLKSQILEIRFATSFMEISFPDPTFKCWISPSLGFHFSRA